MTWALLAILKNFKVAADIFISNFLSNSMRGIKLQTFFKRRPRVPLVHLICSNVMTFGKLDKAKLQGKLLVLVKFLFLIILAPIFWLFIFNTLTVTSSPKIYSLDKAYYTQVSESNGGATTGFVTSVSIIDASTPFNFSQFISFRRGTAKSIFATNGSIKSIQIKWINRNELNVAFNNCDEEYYRDATWKDIKISYEGSCEK